MALSAALSAGPPSPVCNPKLKPFPAITDRVPSGFTLSTRSFPESAITRLSAGSRATPMTSPSGAFTAGWPLPGKGNGPPANEVITPWGQALPARRSATKNPPIERYFISHRRPSRVCRVPSTLHPCRFHRRKRGRPSTGGQVHFGFPLSLLPEQAQGQTPYSVGFERNRSRSDEQKLQASRPDKSMHTTCRDAALSRP